MDSVDDESAEGDAAGLAARINHSSNLREITPCNRSPEFVISAQSVIKRPRCSFVGGNDGKSNVSINWCQTTFRLFTRPDVLRNGTSDAFPASLPSNRYHLALDRLSEPASERKSYSFVPVESRKISTGVRLYLYF